MSPLLPFLLLLLIIVVVIAAMGRPLIRPMGVDMDATARKKQWACRFSLLMFAVPVLVVGVFFIRIALIAGPPSGSFWEIARMLWVATGIAGLLSGIIASHLSKWKGNELLLIAIHALSIFFIGLVCYVSTISWVGV
jgi:hypothetical protein